MTSFYASAMSVALTIIIVGFPALVAWFAFQEFTGRR